MRKTLFGLMVLISFLLSATAHAQFFAPKFAYDKSMAYLNAYAENLEPGKYKAYYFIAPYHEYEGGLEKTPILCVLVQDLENKKQMFFEHGLKYNDNGNVVFFRKEIPMAYTTANFIETQGGEYYIVQDMCDGRGEVARRNWSFTKDPVDRGPASSLTNLLNSGRKIGFWSVDNKAGLERAYSKFY